LRARRAVGQDHRPSARAAGARVSRRRDKVAFGGVAHLDAGSDQVRVPTARSARRCAAAPIRHLRRPLPAAQPVSTSSNS
jgi:hypothetical protein